MSFPNLALVAGGVLVAEASGTPTNGNNTFDVAIPAHSIDDPDWLDILVVSRGPLVSAVSYVGLSGASLTLNFTQAGTDTAYVRVALMHSGVR